MTTAIGTWGPSMLAYTAFLLAVFELARRWVRTYVVLLAVVLAVALVSTPDTPRTGFQTAKLLTITIPCFFFSIVRLAYQQEEGSVLRPLRRPWILVLAYVFMQLNFLEAVVADVQVGQYFNALAGVILAVTTVTPFENGAWRIETATPNRDLLVSLPRAWIVLFTSWNLAFAYAQYPRYTAHVVCVLLAPLLYALPPLNRPDLWLAARVYTLATSLIIRFAGHDFVTPLMSSEGLWSPRVALGWGLLNLLAMVGYVAHRVARRRAVPQAASAATPGAQG
jgi:hypothetical protein